MGGRIAFWTAGLLAIEDMCDRVEGRKDVVNTVVASLSVAGGFSLWNRFPITTAARTAKTGLVFGKHLDWYKMQLVMREEEDWVMWIL
ncbi:hypothetical protein DID88_000197 [Monilinia fructigena]|uniref:Uncharacterized protein n=1 Tax=Monilinia fructigena TaxID=38457 RepID=A0A395IJ70_9HELO|nr:hypothetical protein DID88_000197 [Monilinia fructigena]